MSDIPPVSGASPLTGLAAQLQTQVQTQGQTLGAAIQQQIAANVEKLFDLVSASAPVLAPGTKIEVVVLPAQGNVEIAIAPEGTFALTTPLPQTQTIGPGQATTATLIVSGGDNPIHADLVALAGRPLAAPEPIDLVPLPSGVQLPALPAGTDAQARVVYQAPVGIFAAPPEIASPNETPPVLTLRLTEVGPEIHAEIIAAGTDPKEMMPLAEPVPVTLARVVPALVFPAVPAGIDEQGRAQLATPVGGFVTVAPAPEEEAESLTLRVVSTGPQIETEILARNGKALAVPEKLSLMLPPAQSNPIEAAPKLAQPEAAKILSALGQSWPALHEATEILASSQPALLQQLIDRIPKSGPALFAQILGVLSGLKSGDAGHILGNDVLDALRRDGHAPLADQLENDVKAAGQLAHDSNAEWRPILLPYFDGAALHQVPMLVARPPEGQQSSRDHGTRFVVCVDFSALGAIQLDGFITPEKRQIDLTLRSAVALSDMVKAGVEERFQSAVVASNFGGRIQFKVVNPFPIQVLEQLRFGIGRRLGTVA